MLDRIPIENRLSLFENNAVGVRHGRMLVVERQLRREEWRAEAIGSDVVCIDVESIVGVVLNHGIDKRIDLKETTGFVHNRQI